MAPHRTVAIVVALPLLLAAVPHRAPAAARTGDIRVGYGASPGPHPSRIARVRPE